MTIKPCLSYKPLEHSSCLMNPTTQSSRHHAPHDGVSTNISLSPHSETTQGLRGLRQLGCLLASSGDLLNQDQSQLAWEMCQLLLQAPRDSLAFLLVRTSHRQRAQPCRGLSRQSDMFVY